MISITKGNAPEKLESKNCRNRVADNVRDKIFKGSYYKHSSVLNALENAHHGKCAYCESKIRPVDTPQVEHYRPKNTLKNEIDHPGYYWLGHEWNNLLLACPACNKAKDSRFPIQGYRILAPELLPNGTLDRNQCKPDALPLSEELPLLINPEIDNPEPHFQFHSDGRIAGLTDRGTESIKICKLNRNSLGLKRKGIIDDYLAHFNMIFLAFAENILDNKGLLFLVKQLVKKIKEEAIDQSGYTLFRKQAIQNFESFFVNQVEGARKDDMRRAFQSV